MHWKFYQPTFKYEQMYTDLGGPWAGHKYFGYDLVRNLKPKKIVELGTHLGCSLFSFAQAIQDEKLKTQLDAIDTWQGDKHTGSYDELIFTRVNEIKNACYREVKINLIRKTFDEASKGYSDNSIDMLHIDGLHTYKIVKHDYQTWFDKVKHNGIILLHDVAVKEWGFGVHKLFDEIKQNFMTIKFDHSYGLGVIFKDPRMYKQFKDMIVCLPYYYALKASLKAENYALKAEKGQLEWDFNKQKQKLTEYEQQLTKIKLSRPYKLWQAYKKIKNSLGYSKI